MSAIIMALCMHATMQQKGGVVFVAVNAPEMISDC